MDGSATVKDYAVVLRFEGLYPHHIAGYEAHRTRKGGDLGHVDETRSGLNKRLIGEEDWAAQALAEIREMTSENFAAELESLEKRKRRKDIQRRMVEGPKLPWRPTRDGPMREVILTANREWFAGDVSGFSGVACRGRTSSEDDCGILSPSAESTANRGQLMGQAGGERRCSALWHWGIATKTRNR